MKKFRTWHDARIDAVEVIHETAKFVMELDGRRWAKRNKDSRNYFNTWEDAHEFLLGREKAAIYDLEQQIAKHAKMLRKIEEMKP